MIASWCRLARRLRDGLDGYLSVMNQKGLTDPRKQTPEIVNQ